MSGNAAKPILDYVLSADELAWVQAVYEDFVALRAASARQAQALGPKEALRAVLAKSPTRILNLTGFRPRQPSHEKESQGQLQPRESGFDSRLEVF